jgi:hypothetical protein
MVDVGDGEQERAIGEIVDQSDHCHRTIEIAYHGCHTSRASQFARLESSNHQRDHSETFVMCDADRKPLGVECRFAIANRPYRCCCQKDSRDHVS